jgi:polyhydroxyalkanoate synthesis regulator phasin
MMVRKLDVEEEGQEPVEEAKSGIFEISRKILLAAIGAAVVAEEEITGFVTRLVERGEIAEQDARKLVREIIDRREKLVRDKIAEARRNRPVTVATKADVEALNARIAELAQKIDEIKKEKS